MSKGTQRKGDIGVTRAISTLTALGFDVALPISESLSYDLIADNGEDCYRIQVRYSKNKEIGLRRIHSNSTGYVVKRAKPNAYDWLYVVMADGREYLRKECLVGRSYVTIREQDRIESPLQGSPRGDGTCL